MTMLDDFRATDLARRAEKRAKKRAGGKDHFHVCPTCRAEFICRLRGL